MLSIWKSVKFVIWERIKCGSKKETVFGKIEIRVGKEENTVRQHFLFFFKKTLFYRLLSMGPENTGMY